MSNPGLTSLKCYWKLDEESGWRDDAMGNADLNQSGGVGYAAGHQTFTGNCADLVALTSEYLYTSSTHLQGGNFSICFGLWINPHAMGTNPIIFSKWGGGPEEYELVIIDNKVRFVINDANDVVYTVTSNNFGTLGPNTWYFVGAFFNYVTNTIAVGVNDVWNYASTGIYGIKVDTADFIVGSWAPLTGFFDGYVDEFFFYSNRRLTAPEWTWMYNNGYGRRHADIAQVAPPSINVATKRQMPEIYVYDQALNTLGILEDYSSLNWAERYNSEGDFELELPLSYVDSPLLDFGNFLYIGTSDKLMIIEEKKPTRSPTEGKLLVNGRSVESILRRRTQLQANTWFAPAEYIAYHHVYWSSIGSPFPKRIIDIFEDGSGDPWPPAMENSAVVSGQFASEGIYEVIETVLKIANLGFKIVVSNLASASSKLYFLVYEGLDRSASQEDNDWVIFSNEFDNLLDSSFLTTQKDNINVTQVVTDDPIYKTVFIWKEPTEPEGLNRFEGRLETTIDREDDEPPTPSVDGPVTLPTLSVVSIPGEDNLAAIGITTTPIVGKIPQTPTPPLTDKEVLAIINERGEKTIKEYSPLAIFDGDVDARTQFVLEVDFFLGDIVQVNAHGSQERARIVEVVKSYSVEGEKIYIAFDFEV